MVSSVRGSSNAPNVKTLSSRHSSGSEAGFSTKNQGLGLQNGSKRREIGEKLDFAPFFKVLKLFDC
jgi:hypothetical protein